MKFLANKQGSPVILVINVSSKLLRLGNSFLRVNGVYSSKRKLPKAVSGPSTKILYVDKGNVSALLKLMTSRKVVVFHLMSKVVRTSGSINFATTPNKLLTADSLKALVSVLEGETKASPKGIGTVEYWGNLTDKEIAQVLRSTKFNRGQYRALGSLLEPRVTGNKTSELKKKLLTLFP